MKLRRSIAALAALCVLAAPAALAATAAPPARTTTTLATTGTGGASAPQARAAAAHQRAHHRALLRHLRLAHQAARLDGDRLPHGYRHRVIGAPLPWLVRKNAQLRHEIAVLRRESRQYRAALRRVPYSTLRAIASCESHNNPRAIGGGGAYRGLFQMTFQIWGAVGGHGDPAAASVHEQYLRAALVYARYGSGQWPVCGH
jgi:hypothetical protein